MTNEHFQQFLALLMRLEPENLHRDGEASPKEVRTQERSIRKEWRTLEKKTNQKVTENEIQERWNSGFFYLWSQHVFSLHS